MGVAFTLSLGRGYMEDIHKMLMYQRVTVYFIMAFSFAAQGVLAANDADWWKQTIPYIISVTTLFFLLADDEEKLRRYDE